MSYPRRAQLLYALQSWSSYVCGGLALAGAPIVAASSLVACAGLLAGAIGLLTAGHVCGRRAARYRVGAESERVVADRLRVLEEQGWHVRHSVEWRGRGDIDHVVRAPRGLAFAIETKTGRYDREHLARTRAAAAQLEPGARSCIPVICLARRRGVSLADQGVQVVSADLVATRLTELAGLR